MFHSLTQSVNLFSPRAQLQAIKAYRVGDAWCFAFDFYPQPRKLFLCADASGAAQLEPESLAPSWIANAGSHPLALYLKAYFRNARLAGAHATEDGLALSFSPAGLEWKLRMNRPGELAVELLVPDRKPYTARIQLAPMPSAPGETSAAELKTQSKDEKKKTKLLANVASDLRDAEEWLKAFAGICQRLEEEPLAWAYADTWPAEWKERIETLQKAGELPLWGRAGVGKAQDALFKLRRRMERKRTGAAKRLETVQKVKKKEAPTVAPTVAPSGPKKIKVAGVRKGPGLWIELSDGLWARLGRSAQENAALFKQAKDRDLWFHVRGQSGAHVWVPRGQPDFGSKDDPSDDILRLGCQLALVNSKAVKGGSATVDYTERRHLKSIAGAIGKVEIRRSETRFTRLDEAFARRVMGK